ncbi:MAG: hypothetical protein ACI4ES_01690 [Roseburia sp.]
MAKSKSSANSLDIFGNMQKLNGKTSSGVKNEGLTSPEPVQKFHITFLNDTDIFAEYEVEEGENIPYPEASPEKAADSMFRYHFSGWDKTLTKATENAIIHAQYEKEALTFTVQFQVEDKIIHTEEIVYGSLASAPTQPVEKEDDDQYHYTFVGWEPAITTPITKATLFTASFSKSELPKEVPVKEELFVKEEPSIEKEASSPNNVLEKEADNITSSTISKETDIPTAPVKAKVGRPATKKGIAKKVNVLFTEDTMEIINTAKVFFDGNMTKYLETLIMEDYKKNKELYDTLAKTKRI